MSQRIKLAGHLDMSQQECAQVQPRCNFVVFKLKIGSNICTTRNPRDLPTRLPPGRHAPPTDVDLSRVLGEVWERVLELLDRGALGLKRDTVDRELNVHRRQRLALFVEDAKRDDVPALRAVLQVGLARIDPGAVWRRNGGPSRARLADLSSEFSFMT